MSVREYVTPRVSISIDDTKLIAPSVGQPNIVIVVGTSQWGPLDTVTEISTLTEARTYFKGDVSAGTDVTLPKALQLLFGNGASNVKVFRIDAAAGAAVKATKNFLKTATPVLQFDGKYYGEHGNNITVTITTNGAGRDVVVSDGYISEQVIGAATNAAIVSGFANSNLVTVTQLTADLVDAITATNLASGANGAGTANGDYTTALATLETVVGDIIVLAGQTDAALHASLKTHCESMALNNKPRISFVGSAVGTSVATASAAATTLASDRVIYSYPGIKMLNEAGTEITVSAGYGAAAIAGMVASRDVNISITNKQILGITGLESTLNDANLKTLINAHALPLAEGRIGGFVPIKDITTSTNAAFSILTTRRIVDYVINNTILIGEQFIGRLNLPATRGALKGVIDSFMTVSERNNIVEDFTIDVVASRADEILGICIVNLKLLPVFSIYYIDVNLELA